MFPPQSQPPSVEKLTCVMVHYIVDIEDYLLSRYYTLLR